MAFGTPQENTVDSDTTYGTVTGWLNILNQYANNSVISAAQAANNLHLLDPVTFAPDIDFQIVDGDLGLGDLTSRPIPPNLTITPGSIPPTPSLNTPNIQLQTIPTFDEPDPSLNLPDVPAPLNASVPVKDFVINTSFEYPDSPDSALPEVPTLISLNIPTALDLNIPVFSLDFPTSASLVPPGITFGFNEDLYSSTLLDRVKDELLSRLSGGTGLSPEVEEAIWNRERDREQRASLLAERTLLIERSSQGFSRPSGATQAALNQIVQETQSKIIDLGREIMIKQAEMEQENIKTSIQQVIALEEILIRDHQATVQRAFETAKYLQDVQIELFKIAVSKFSSEVEAYKAFSQAYQARVSAELSKIEIFKAQIEAEKLKGDINEQNIKIYLARIEAIKNNVEIYKTLVSTVTEKLKAEELKLSVYKTDIEAYGEVVKAKALEYQSYAEQMKGELAKTEIFDSKVKAYTSRVQAYTSINDSLIKKASVEVDIQELLVKQYEAQIDAYIKGRQEEQLKFQSAVDLYRAQTSIYIADSTVINAQAELKLKEMESIILQNKYTADIAIENAKILLENIKSNAELALEAGKSAGNIYQAIASSALSAINVSAGIQATNNINFSGEV